MREKLWALLAEWVWPILVMSVFFLAFVLVYYISEAR